jgi:hypothetical protein
LFYTELNIYIVDLAYFGLVAGDICLRLLIHNGTLLNGTITKPPNHKTVQSQNGMFQNSTLHNSMLQNGTFQNGKTLQNSTVSDTKRRGQPACHREQKK